MGGGGVFSLLQTCMQMCETQNLGLKMGIGGSRGWVEVASRFDQGQGQFITCVWNVWIVQRQLRVCAPRSDNSQHPLLWPHF